ncbi:hypothetical protein BGZ96_009814 [Linnemannia gamsii]|uniref:Uncharacterized protein n=1 Tax=Linnemannia gamsii TaxID=64522 RepID=A0ABQ7JVQ5_9FUNG|nr:hypothetical protein BGZ96_009814 [Linnemannia gamsii]
MAHRTRQQTLDNRKENIKHHRIVSAAMACELEPVNHSPSPSENAAKRKQYNTRQSSITSPSSSSSTVALKLVAQKRAFGAMCLMPEQNNRLGTASPSPASSESYKPSKTSSVLTNDPTTADKQGVVSRLSSWQWYPSLFSSISADILVDGYDLSQCSGRCATASRKKWASRLTTWKARCRSTPIVPSEIETQHFAQLENFYRRISALTNLKILELHMIKLDERGQAANSVSSPPTSFPAMLNLANAETGQPGFLHHLGGLTKLKTLRGLMQADAEETKVAMDGVKRHGWM